MCHPALGAVIGGAVGYGGAAWAGMSGAAMYTAVASAAMSGMSYGSQVQQSNIQARNEQAALTSNTLQYYRDLEFRELQQGFQHSQFMADLGMRVMQAKGAQAQFMQDIQFRQEQLAYDVMQREMAIESMHLQEMNKMEYARETMKAAWEAAALDTELLEAQWKQHSSKAELDIFERKRQAMKEGAQIRVSQGESGIFGNSALKELANSIMQSSWDTGIMDFNLKNEGKQAKVEAKKIKATAMSRTNEALSGVVNRYLTGTAMNPAVASLQI